MDLVGQPVPAGMIAAKEVPSLLPSYDMMVYDPANAYLALTGQQNNQATTQQCIAAYMQRIQQETASQPSAGFVYSSSNLITALKNGYVVEIQEVVSIQKPGVLVSLNSLLEKSGSIHLLTGERITRHPEAVVVMTTNVDYVGLEAINQSVLDRMDLIVDFSKKADSAPKGRYGVSRRSCFSQNGRSHRRIARSMRSPMGYVGSVLYFLGLPAPS